MLNVRGEKVSEALFLGALKKAVAQWPPAQLVDYCCAESGLMGKACGLCHKICNLTSLLSLFEFLLLGILLYCGVMCCRGFNRWLRPSLPGVCRAERCEEPHRGAAIQSKRIPAKSKNTMFVF